MATQKRASVFARVAHDYGVPVLVRGKCLSGCAIIALSAWRGRLFVVGSGAIGLHQSSIGEDYAHAIPSLEGTRKVARALRGYGRAWVGRREDDANAATGYDISQRRRAKAERRGGEAPSVKTMRLARSADDRWIWIAVEGKLAPFGLSERRIDLERPLELGSRILDAAKAIEYHRPLHRAEGRLGIVLGAAPHICR